MFRVELTSETDLAGWRDAVARLLTLGTDAGAVSWTVGSGGGDLFGTDPLPDVALTEIQPDVLKLAKRVIPHSDPGRFAVLHDLAVRSRKHPALLERSIDPAVFRAALMAKAVKRDIHKMHAFVRFRQVPGADPEQFVAWFEPDHFIEEATAPFFARRLTDPPGIVREDLVGRTRRGRHPEVGRTGEGPKDRPLPGREVGAGAPVR